MGRKIGYVLSVIVAAVVPVVVLVMLPAWGILVGVALLIAWLALTRTGRQAWSATAVAVSTIPQRIGSSSVVIIGIAGVVGVLVALLAMAEGFRATLQQTGSDDTAIVLRAGSQTEINSVVDHDSVVLVSDMPQVMRDKQSRPIASPEIVVAASIPKKSNGVDSNVEIRGVGDEAWELYPRFRMVTGRRFGSGLRELIVGKDAAREFAHTGMGSTLDLNGQPWTVVGVFDSGDSHNSELWADTGVVATTYHRGSSTSSVTVRLQNPGLFDAFRTAIKEGQLFFNWDYFDRATAFGGGAASFYIERAARLQQVFSVGSAIDALSANSDHETKTQSEDAFIASLASRFADIGLIVGSIMGAVFFTLILLTGNTMAQAVRERIPELAILKTIGFSGRGILALVLAESVLLLAAGGTLGLALSTVAVSELRAKLGAQIPVLPVGVATWLSGVALMIAVGIMVGALPARRGMRLRIVDALSRQ